MGITQHPEDCPTSTNDVVRINKDQGYVNCLFDTYQLTYTYGDRTSATRTTRRFAIYKYLCDIPCCDPPETNILGMCGSPPFLPQSGCEAAESISRCNLDITINISQTLVIYTATQHSQDCHNHLIQVFSPPILLKSPTLVFIIQNYTSSTVCSHLAD